MPELHIENLIPVRTEEEAREKGRNGGIASGKAKREKKLLSQIYADFLSDKLSIKMDGITKEVPAMEYVKECIKRGLAQNPSPMLREIREATEGGKLDSLHQTIVIFDERFKKA